MAALNEQRNYLSELRNGVHPENYFIQHIFDRMSVARFSAVEKAREGKVREFRHAFMKTPKEVVLRGGEGIPFKSYNRHTLSESEYKICRQLFETVSQEDAIRYYEVTAEQYALWMVPWTTFYFYVGRSPHMFTHITSMDFPNVEIAMQQTGDYPEYEWDGNSDLWNEDYRSTYDSIDDDPNLIYRIMFVGTEPPKDDEKPTTLFFEQHPKFTT
jgi:hypothetical protein